MEQIILERSTYVIKTQCESFNSQFRWIFKTIFYILYAKNVIYLIWIQRKFFTEVNAINLKLWKFERAKCQVKSANKTSIGLLRGYLQKKKNILTLGKRRRKPVMVLKFKKYFNNNKKIINNNAE